MSTHLPTVDVVWFKRDLRITDHAPLNHAQQSGRPLILLYTFEPSVMAASDFGSNHLGFINDSLTHLNHALNAHKAQLLICHAEVIQVFEELVQHVHIATLRSHREVGNIITYKRDKAVKRWCQQHQIEWHEYSCLEVQRPHPNRDHWAKNWEKEMKKPVKNLSKTPLNCLPLPHLKLQLHTPLQHQDIHKAPPAPSRQPNQRGNPIGLLDSFLTDRCHNYRKAMASPLLAPRACSRMSPHLSYGTVSIREVVQHTRDFYQQHALNGTHLKAIESFVSRLHWRGHFMQKLEDQVDIEWRCLDPRTENLRPAGQHEARLDAWKTGHTGVPMVDACMRFLNHHGWINFRMRAMLVSFACYNLWLDWREIHPHLAQAFTDYEPGIHLSQLQMQAGTTGINTLRIYNPIKQSQELDPNGLFIRKWVPEIASRNHTNIHLPANQIKQSSLFDEPENYPRPVVDLQDSAHHAREIMFGIRKTPHQAIARVIKMHASRKKWPSQRRQT
ncbi:MAG: FAD-binding domain-containing protein [Myxococcota bacterium]